MLIISDRVKESSVTEGSGAVTLGLPFGSFQSFSEGIGNGNTTYYAIENGVRWEVGQGVYSTAGNLLSRDVIFDSSASGAKINLEGTSTVFCTLPASKAVVENTADNVYVAGISTLELNASGISSESINNSGQATFGEKVLVSGNLELLGQFQYNGDLSSVNGITTSGDIVSSGLLTLVRPLGDEGNFFHAYKDDGTKQTVALHVNSSASPLWKLGLKTNPNSETDPPTFAYVFARDGSIGLVSNTNNYASISDDIGFTVQNVAHNVLRVSSLTGVYLETNSSANPSLVITGPPLNAKDLTRWSQADDAILSVVDSGGKIGILMDTPIYELDVNGSGRMDTVHLTSGLYFQDGTFQSTAASGSGGGGGNATAVSGWADTTMTNRDNAVSGFAATTLANEDAAVSGFAAITIANGDASISGWASGTVVIGDNAVSGWADSTIDTRDAAVSGWADITMTAKDAAISGWADSTMTSRDNAVSGWANSTMIAKDTAISGWAATTITNGDAAISGFAATTITNGDLAVSGFSATTIANGDAAVSGWADTTMTNRDNALSGYLETYVDNAAGSGLILNGDKLDVDFNNFAAVTLGSGDSFAMLNANGTSEQRVTISELGAYLSSGVSSNLTVNGSGQLTAAGGGGGGSFNDFDITDSGGVARQVDDGETIKFVSGTEVTFQVTSDGTTHSVSGALINSSGYAISVSGWADTTMTNRDNAVSGWAATTITNGDNAVSGWASTHIGSVSGWADSTMTSRDAAISGWAATTITNGDLAVSGFAATTIANADAAISGWADTTMTNRDNAVSGWADSTMSARDAAISGWADSTMTSRDNAISGWADTTITNGDAAVSGFAATTITDGDAAISGFAVTTIANGDLAVSGFAATTIANGDLAVSGFAATTIANGDAAISGFAATTIENGDLAVSGFAATTIANGDLAVSGFAATTIANGDLAVSGFAATTITNGDNAVSGWAGTHIGSVSGWADTTMTNRDNAISGWAGTTITNGDAAISGFAATTIANGDAAVSGWASSTFGDVSKVGTPVNDQIGVWTGDGTLEGGPDLTWDGSELDVAGTVSTSSLKVDNDDIRIYATDGLALFYGNGAANGLWFLTNAGNSVYVSNAGFLSVNEITPEAQLHVQTSSSSVIGQIIKGSAVQSANLFEARDSADNIGARVNAALEFSNPSQSSGTNNEIFGAGAGAALTTGTDNTLIGKSAGSGIITGTQNVIIGYHPQSSINGTSTHNNVLIGANCFHNASQGDSNVCIGNASLFQGVSAGYNIAIGPSQALYRCSTGAKNIALGSNTGGLGAGANMVNGDYNIFIGDGAGVVADGDNGIAIGRNAVTAANALVIGSTTVAVDDIYFGKGITDASPTSYILHGTGGSGTDVAGAGIIIAGGKGTGTGVGGDIVFQTATAGSTGSSLNNLATALTISSVTQNVLLQTSGTGIIGQIIKGTSGQTANLFEAQDSSGNVGASINAALEFTNSGGFASTLQIGPGTTVSATLQTVIGAGASGGGDGSSTVIGSNAGGSASFGGVCIGSAANILADHGIAIGAGSHTFNNVGAIVIGHNAKPSYGVGFGVCIGSSASFTAANQFVSGASLFPINEVYFGKGVTHATPTAFSLNGTGGDGTDISGAGIIIAGGKGTGTGVGGDIVFQTAIAGSTGSSLNTLTAALTIDAETQRLIVAGRIVLAKALKTPIDTESDGTTITFDCDESNLFTVTLGGNRILALSNVDVGQRFIIRLTQDGTGTRTVTWFSTIKWPGALVPTLTSTINKTDVFGFICTGSNEYDGYVIGYNL